MPPEGQKIVFTTLEVPRVRRGPWGFAKIAGALVAIGGIIWAWQSGYRPALWAKEAGAVLEFIEIDRGDINLFVQETGTIESANNTTIRCEVEALLGMVGGTQSGATGKAGAGGTSGQGSGAQGTSGTGGTDSTQATGKTSASKSKTAKKAGSSSTSKTGTSTGSGSSSTASGGTTASGSASASGSGSTSSSTSTGTSASGSGTGGSSTTSAKPVLRSFTYAVVRHIPLRPITAKSADSAAQKKAQQQQQGGGGGGRGGGSGKGGGGGGGRGGRGGGGRGGMMEDEKPGSTTIVEIVPEGTRVKAGDVVCKLDSSSYEDEEKAQLIRFLQAKSYVEQANAILEVNLITQREYRDGIYPQDVQLIRQYIETCQLEHDRLQRNVNWSKDMQNKGFRTHYQVRGDVLSLEQAKIALGEAQNMLERLIKQTGPKILKSLEANVQAIKSDKFTQDAAFSLETQRLDRIRKNIKNCTLKAPRDGIVVYANQADSWGQVTALIDQGVTVRQDQPIINLPDPLNMRVKARVNESKVTMVQTGQTAKILVDAFPDRPLIGRVAEITAINVPLNASDVRVYYANVDIQKGFDDLRPGLSAEVIFMIDAQKDVTRVPLDSVRWAGGNAYVALYDRSLEQSGKGQWRWRPVQLGLSDTYYAAVTSGLEIGDRVVANPRGLLPRQPRTPRHTPPPIWPAYFHAEPCAVRTIRPAWPGADEQSRSR